MKKKPEKTDLEICRDKIKSILIEYNCRLTTNDWHYVLLEDQDTYETIGDIDPGR
jgi:hypothetical protein